MTGGCGGGGSGAGIRFSKAGIGGAGAAKSGAGLRTRPDPWAKPAPKPSRAKPGVDPTIQVTANTAAKMCFMFASLFCCASLMPTIGHRAGKNFISIAEIGPPLRSSLVAPRLKESSAVAGLRLIPRCTGVIQRCIGLTPRATCLAGNALAAAVAHRKQMRHCSLIRRICVQRACPRAFDSLLIFARCVSVRK